MKKLYYLSSLDLLLRVQYNKDANSIRFVTHRSLKPDEKKVIEEFVLKRIKEIDQSFSEPSMLFYLGVDDKLSADIRYYRLRGTIDKVLTKKQNIDQQVQDLIHSSLSTYYFEQLGVKILDLRKSIGENAGNDEIDGQIYDIKTLLDAYNMNSGQRLELSQVLPKEVFKTIKCQF